MGLHCPEELKKSRIDLPQVLQYARKKGITSDVPFQRSPPKENLKVFGPENKPPGWDERHKKKETLIKIGSTQFLMVSGLAGTFVCGGSHLLSTPLDVLKCRIQVDKQKYPDLKTAFRTTIREEGIRGLGRGWAPTLIGYSAQGFAKFGLYESFKKLISEKVGPENTYIYRTLVFASAAAAAEAVGDVALAPFEAAKVRTQTRPGAPAQMFRCLPMIYRSEGMNGLFKGLPALWMRQIPYTVSKFVCFEYAVDGFLKLMNKRKAECNNVETLQITMAAAVVAGTVSAICSHPPDVIVSQLYKNPEASFFSVCKNLGFNGLWAGLATRILMIGSIAASQLFIVDSVKLALKLERPSLPQYPESLKNKLK